MHDAHCPRLGAHLGHGGRVEAGELACPFHGWRFDADGRNTCIPYSERTNAGARLRSYPVVERYETEGHTSHMRSKQFFVTRRGTVEGRIDTDAAGPGFSVVRFNGIVDTVLLGCATPIEADRCEMRFTFTVRRLADERATTSVAGAAIDEISRQLLQDKPIWEHKIYLERPALADTDGPFLAFRRWASQFYAG